MAAILTLVGMSSCKGDYDDWAGSGAFELYESVFGPLSDDDMARLGETLNWS